MQGMIVHVCCRFLRGSCGLKSTWGYEPSTPGTVAFCEEAVDWNIHVKRGGLYAAQSLSARKLWIEISDPIINRYQAGGRFLRGSCGLKLLTARHTRTTRHVAFCEEAVDWNSGWLTIVRAWKVAFYEEAVDWNSVVEDIWSILYVHFTKREDSHVFQ